MLQPIKKSPLDKVEHRIINISPRLAADYLEDKYHRQRPLREKQVKKLTDAMKNGKWLFDGSPIRFDKDGALIDGQHRLHALIRANQSYPFMVVNGLDTETFLVMDTGAKRSSQDVCAIEGYGQIKGTLARLARLVVSSNYGRDNYIEACRGRTRLANNQEIDDAIKWRNGELIEYARVFNDKRYANCRKWFGAGDSAYFYWLFSRINSHDTDLFFPSLESGQNLDQESPILALRNKLYSDRFLDGNTLAQKFTKGAFLVKTWNAFRESRKITYFRFGENEAFPKAV